LPLGILQPPFYNSDGPNVLNYGGIGFSIGHELTHAFDDHGRRFGADGSLKDWWSNATAAEFRSRAECLVQQYNDLRLSDSCVNGRNTLGENIADNGGIKAAYFGFFGDEDNGRLRGQVPRGGEALGLTEEQLFFVSYAQVWCNANSRDYELAKIASNAHPPSELRVKAVVANSEQFSAAFSCPESVNQRCGVW